MTRKCNDCRQPDPKCKFVCKNCPSVTNCVDRSSPANGMLVDDINHPSDVTFFVCNSECQKASWKRHKMEHALKAKYGFDGFEVGNPKFFKQECEETKSAKWLVDAYRLRVDDDYAIGGGNLHGLYDAMTNDYELIERKVIIMKDFLLFVKMAVKHGEIKSDDKENNPTFWDDLTKEACSKIGYAYEKSDCAKDYQSCTPFSMRSICEKIYGTSSLMSSFSDPSHHFQDMESEIELVFEYLDGLMDRGRLNHKTVRNFWDRSRTVNFLKDVGGVSVWRNIFNKMKVPQ